MYDAGKGIDVVERPSPRRLKIIDYLTAVASGREQFCEEALNRLIMAENYELKSRYRRQ